MVFLRRNLPLVERFPQYQQKDDLNGINQVGQKMSEINGLLKKEFTFSGKISSVLTER